MRQTLFEFTRSRSIPWFDGSVDGSLILKKFRPHEGKAERSEAMELNGQLYEIEADCEPHHFPDIGNMIRAKTLRVPLKPLCFIQRVISWAVNTH
jgi:hypothetical protein